MSNIVPFSFHKHQVRVLPEGDSFWTVAQDIASILSYRDAYSATRVVPSPHKGTKPIRTPGGVQQMLCVDEPGLYRMILRSDKPEAEPFMEWVTSQVLPSVRRTGVYSHPEAAASQLQALREELLRAHPLWAKIVRYDAAGLTHAEIARLIDRAESTVGREKARMIACGLLPPPAQARKRSPAVLSESQREQALALFDRGFTKAAIARQCGCHHRVIDRLLDRATGGAA